MPTTRELLRSRPRAFGLEMYLWFQQFKGNSYSKGSNSSLNKMEPNGTNSIRRISISISINQSKMCPAPQGRFNPGKTLLVSGNCLPMADSSQGLCGLRGVRLSWNCMILVLTNDILLKFKNYARKNSLQG